MSRPHLLRKGPGTSSLECAGKLAEFCGTGPFKISGQHREGTGARLGFPGSCCRLLVDFLCIGTENRRCQPAAQHALASSSSCCFRLLVLPALSGCRELALCQGAPRISPCGSPIHTHSKLELWIAVTYPFDVETLAGHPPAPVRAKDLQGARGAGHGRRGPLSQALKRWMPEVMIWLLVRDLGEEIAGFLSRPAMCLNGRSSTLRRCFTLRISGTWSSKPTGRPSWRGPPSRPKP